MQSLFRDEPDETSPTPFQEELRRLFVPPAPTWELLFYKMNRMNLMINHMSEICSTLNLTSPMLRVILWWLWGSDSFHFSKLFALCFVCLFWRGWTRKDKILLQLLDLLSLSTPTVMCFLAHANQLLGKWGHTNAQRVLALRIALMLKKLVKAGGLLLRHPLPQWTQALKGTLYKVGQKEPEKPKKKRVYDNTKRAAVAAERKKRKPTPAARLARNSEDTYLCFDHILWRCLWTFASFLQRKGNRLRRYIHIYIY